MKHIRIGAGYSGDRIEPAVELAEKGDLDYLIFECLAEHTIAIGQQARRADPQKGYDHFLVDRMHAVLKLCADKGIKIISNMGAANPLAGAAKVREIALTLGLPDLKIAAVSGDDVLDILRQGNYRIEDNGLPVMSLGEGQISYAGPGAQARAQLALDIVWERLAIRRYFQYFRDRL